MPSKAATTSTISDDAIRTRAYLLWEADGQPFGRDAHYWDLAVAELLTPPKPKRAAAATAVPEKTAKVAAKPAKASKSKKV